MTLRDYLNCLAGYINVTIKRNCEKLSSFNWCSSDYKKCSEIIDELENLNFIDLEICYVRLENSDYWCEPVKCTIVLNS